MAWTNTIVTTEFAGTRRLLVLSCTPDDATEAIDLSSYCTGITGAVATFAGDATANCYSISTSVSTTTLTVKLWKAGGTAADTAYVALTIFVAVY